MVLNNKLTNNISMKLNVPYGGNIYYVPSKIRSHNKICSEIEMLNWLIDK